MPLQTLSRRGDVRHLFGTGKRAHLQVLTVVATRSPDGSDAYLFVAGKKVGGAVVRNRVKRRLRALVRALGPELAPGWWIALIAKPETVAARHDFLAARVKDGLSRLGVLARPAKAPEA